MGVFRIMGKTEASFIYSDEEIDHILSFVNSKFSPERMANYVKRRVPSLSYSFILSELQKYERNGFFAFEKQDWVYYFKNRMYLL